MLTALKQDMMDGSNLERILQKTIQAIEKSKEQIFQILEDARAEREKIIIKLDKLQAEIEKVIDEVDRLEVSYRKARIHLADVSSNFNKYTEHDIHNAYEEANKLQVDLTVAREREGTLKAHRNDLQLRLKMLEQTIERAELLITQVGVVFDYLSGDIIKMAEVVESAQHRQLYGLKIIQAQEEERKRVAREIHDGPAQSMANVVLRTEIAERLMNANQPQMAMKELKDLKFMVRQSLADVRKIIFDLRPMALDDLGLFPTLRKFVQEMSKREDLPIELNLRGRERRLPSGLEVAIFRLVQEALNNVIKHSKATHVEVFVEYQESFIRVLVKDNGVGFDHLKVEKEKGRFGLMGMKERVQLLEGDMEIESVENLGTSVTVSVPIKESGE